MTAFALTIHKAQGLSLQCAIVDAGSACFGPGMIYVGLSRITSLQGLHLVDIDKKKVKCDKKALTGYNRLRKLYTPQIGELSVDVVNSTHQPVLAPQNHSKTYDDDDCVDVTNINLTQQNNDKTSHQVNYTKATTVEKTKFKKKNHNVNIHSSSIEEGALTFSSITSINLEAQESACNQLNLSFISDELATTSRAEYLVSKELQLFIYKETQRKVLVNIYQVRGDGNCLFRSISLAVTGTQNQHQLLRSYIVNHMCNDGVRKRMEPLFICPDNNETYFNHLVNMEGSGCWGTDQEIVAAAYLFNISILCYCHYNSDNMTIQEFSPHFVVKPTCSATCRHETIY